MKFIKAVVVLLALMAGTPSLAQQTYPNRVVRIVVGVSPGGVQDLLARTLAQDLSSRWGQSVVVENHPGAAGIVASTLVAKAPPDGYTILMSPSSAFESAPVLQKNLQFDPIKDFIPVVGLATAKAVVVISSKVPANNLKEFVALARAKPGAMSYGSWGIASVAHLDAEALAKGIDAKFLHVPYKGGNEVMVALAAGQIDLAVVTVSTALPSVKQGRVKGLAYFGDTRSVLLPDVPTIAETGFTVDRPGGAFSFYVPASTPKSITDKITADTRKALATPAFRKNFFDPNAMEPYPYEGAALQKQLDASRESYLARLKELNVKFD